MKPWVHHPRVGPSASQVASDDGRVSELVKAFALLQTAMNDGSGQQLLRAIAAGNPVGASPNVKSAAVQPTTPTPTVPALEPAAYKATANQPAPAEAPKVCAPATTTTMLSNEDVLRAKYEAMSKEELATLIAETKAKPEFQIYKKVEGIKPEKFATFEPVEELVAFYHWFSFASTSGQAAPATVPAVPVQAPVATAVPAPAQPAVPEQAPAIAKPAAAPAPEVSAEATKPVVPAQAPAPKAPAPEAPAPEEAVLPGVVVFTSSSHRAEYARLTRKMGSLSADFPECHKLWAGNRKDSS